MLFNLYSIVYYRLDYICINAVYICINLLYLHLFRCEFIFEYYTVCIFVYSSYNTFVYLSKVFFLYKLLSISLYL